MTTFQRHVLIVAMAALFCAGSVHAEFIVPANNLVVEGIPPIPAELAQQVAPYSEIKPSVVVAWHPTDGSLLISTRLRNSAQLHRIKSLGAEPEPLTDFADAVTGATFQPQKGEYLLFNKATGGDEVFRIYRMDLATRVITPISAADERASNPSWNRKGDRIVYTTVTIDRNNKGEGAARTASTKVIIADPLKPDTAKVIATLEGGGWNDFRFSPDDKQLLAQEYISINKSHLWLFDVATGKKQRLLNPALGAAVAYANARFSRDGKGIYAISDRDSEFRRLVYIDLKSRRERVLTEKLKHDVDGYSISYKAKRIAFVTNEEGSSVLRFLDLNTYQEMPRPSLVPGVISGLRWKGLEDEDSSNPQKSETALLAFNMASARSANEVFSLDSQTNKIVRWTNGASPNLNAQEFVDPKLVRWKSFDGLIISGFLYQPNAQKFRGKRPVIINIHGGPEGQARPGFLARNNYFINELGVAMLYPNVRGSEGFGKTFLTLDNGMKREDSVKDIGALFDWIKEQPDLNAERVLVSGGSYGGYMSLAVATRYPDRIAGAIDVVGISNFVTFLTNTESYRRDLRRAEYGDERDPAMRHFMENIAPLNNADKIDKPLFVVQGKNDPRVPYTEALQIVEKVKKQGVPVWFLMANDEGHGFAKKSNQDFLFYAQIQFLEKTLGQ